MAGDVKLTVTLQAQDRATKTIYAANKAIKANIKSLVESGAAQTQLGASVASAIGNQTEFSRSIVRTADTASKLYSKLANLKTLLAVGFLIKAAQQMWDLASKGARAADQIDAVRGRVAQTDELLSKMREETTGIIAEEDMVNAIAAFDSFGLSLDALPHLMREAAKTSLRTGEDVSQLTDDAIRGVARLSPAILDNLGLQVKLSDATQRAAEKFGVEASAVSDTQRKAGMLALVIEQLGTLNRDIDLNDSRVASLKRLEVGYEDSVSSMRQGLAGFVTGVEGAQGAIGNLSAAIEADLMRTANQARQSFDRLFKSITQAAVEAIQVDRVMQRLGLAQRERMLKERELRKEMAKLRREADREIIKAERRMARELEANLDADDVKRRFLRSISTAEQAIDAQAEQAAKRATARAAAMIADEREKMTAHLARIAALERELKLMRGMTKNQIAIEEQNEAIKEQVAIRKEAEKTIVETTASLGRLTNVQKRDAKARIKAAQDRKDAAIEEHEILLEHIGDLVAIDKESKKGTKTRARRTKTVNKSVAAAARERLAIVDRIRALREEAALRSVDDRDQAARLKFEQAKAAAIRETAGIQDEAQKVALRQLLIDKAAAAMSKETTEITRENSEAIRDQTSAAREAFEGSVMIAVNGASGAFSAGAAILGDLDQQLTKLGHGEKYNNVREGFNAISANVGGAAETFLGFGDSSLDAGEKAAAGVAAGLGVVGPAVAGFVDGVTEKALVMGAFEAAMAVSEAFVNPAAAISHGIASAMFFAMAGVSAGTTSTKAPEEAASGGAGGGFGPERGGGSEPATIVVNLGEGMVFGRPAEIGRAVAQNLASLSNSGMASTAY